MRIQRYIIYRLLVIGSLIASNFSFAASPKSVAPLFTNLGNYHHSITTNSSLAQRYFDQGLILFYGFDSGEAIRSFQASIKVDPTCAMCYWGLALALGSRNNMPCMVMNGHSDKQNAYLAIKKARALVSPQNSVEVAYINALSQKHSASDALEQYSSKAFTHGASLATNKEALNYADAMHKVVQQFPADLDAKDLYVFALFDVSQWNFWSQGKIQPNTAEIVDTLQSVLTTDPHNVAANHYYIHVIEQSAHPEDALISANFLLNAVPGAEHLLHMPAHIYLLTGRYHEASIANQKAIAAFKQYQEDCRTQGFEPEINYLYQHNYHFLLTAAMMEGRGDLALTTAKQLLRLTPSSWVKSDLYLQLFLPSVYFVEARFGKWNEILNAPEPSRGFSYTQGMWHYARGIAYIHLGKLKNAQKEYALLQQIAKQDPNPNNLSEYGNGQLTIATEVLAATIADYNNQDIVMIKHWENAINIADHLGYKEPPVWYFPVREGLGYALLKLNHNVEAETMFKQELKKYPDDGWALFGLEQSLRTQGKNQDADQIHTAFIEAWRYADIKSPIEIMALRNQR